MSKDSKIKLYSWMMLFLLWGIPLVFLTSLLSKTLAGCIALLLLIVEFILAVASSNLK